MLGYLLGYTFEGLYFVINIVIISFNTSSCSYIGIDRGGKSSSIALPKDYTYVIMGRYSYADAVKPCRRTAESTLDGLSIWEVNIHVKSKTPLTLRVTL